MKKKQKPYLETWIYREQGEQCTCVFIVQLRYDEDGRMTGELRVKLPGTEKVFTYQHPLNMNLRGSLFVVLGKNVFTEACIHIQIEEPDLYMKGDLFFDREYKGPRVGFRRKIWALEQELSGTLWIEDKEVSFDGGKGYLEEVRGPEEKQVNHVFWSQSNWFGQQPFRIVCGGTENACFAVIDQNGYPIRFAPWKGAKVEHLDADGFRISQRHYVLEGWRTAEVDSKNVDQTVRYRLTHGSNVLFDEISQRAGYGWIFYA